MQNTKRIVNIGFVALAAVVGYFVLQVTDTLWGVFRFHAPQDLPFTPAQLIGVVAGVIVFILVKRNNRIVQFCDEVVAELAKVTWPPKKETLLSTVVVSIMVGICALILFCFDTLWGTLVKLLYQ